MELQTGSLPAGCDLGVDLETNTYLMLPSRTHRTSSPCCEKKYGEKLSLHFPSSSVTGAGMQNRAGYHGKASAGNPCEAPRVPPGGPSPPAMEKDCSEWQGLGLQGIDMVAVLPYRRTTGMLSLPSSASSSGYVYISAGKENRYMPSCNGPGGFDNSEDVANAASMDTSQSAPPFPLRTPEIPACSLLSPVLSPPSAGTPISPTTSCASYCPASGEESDSGSTVGSESVDGSFADLSHLEYQRLKPQNLRYLHASIVSLIDRDCSYLIKHGLLPCIHPPHPGSSTDNTRTISLHFQDHLRTCISSFRAHLITWQTALYSCLTMPPRKRKVILPEYLTLVPSFTHLVLELNIRVNTSAVFQSQPACTLYNTDTNTNITTAQLVSSGKKTTRTCPPDPITLNYALSKLALAELCIAAYLSEAETYQDKFSPLHSIPAKLMRKLSRRVRKESEPSIEEANTCCTEMWKGHWGILDSSEHTTLSCGSSELRKGTGARKAVRGREKKIAVVVETRERERNVSSGGSVPAGKKKKGRDKGRKRKESEREKGRNREEDKLIQQRAQLAREFTWWWEDGVAGTN